MKRNITFLITLAAIALISAINPQCADARKGETSVGILGGFTTKNSSPAAGLFFQYGFSDHVMVAPQLGCVFRNKDLDNFFFDVNVLFPFNLRNSIVSAYPLAGISYTSWDNHKLSESSTDDVSTRKSRLGLNLGAGLSVQATKTFKVKIDLIYTLNKGYSTFTPLVGIGYTF